MDGQAAFESGGAGLVSTIDDYARFAGMLLERGRSGGVRLMKPETADRMMHMGLTVRQQTAFDRWFGQKGYAYGCLMRRLQETSHITVPGLEGEYCWDGWLGCCFYNYPAERLTLLIMQQQKNGGDLALRIRAALVRRIPERV